MATIASPFFHAIVAFTILGIPVNARLSTKPRGLRGEADLEPEVSMSMPAAFSPHTPKTTWMELPDICLPSQDEKNLLVQEKRNNYGGITFQQFSELGTPPNNPLTPYYWEDTVFINWKIDPTKINDMQDTLGLPNHLRVVPITSVEPNGEGNETEEYFLSFAVKSVDVASGFFGTETTTQGDWFVYVTDSRDETNNIHLMNIGNEYYSFSSQSPTGIIRPSGITHEVGPNSIQLFGASFDTSNASRRKLSPRFISAFGRMYFKNGVYSVLGSNGSLSLAEVNYMDDQPFGGSNAPLADFLSSTSSDHIISFPKTLQLTSEVWVNARSFDTAGDSTILNTRENVYNSRVRNRATQLFTGSRTAQAVVKFDVTQDAPYYYMNFRIKDMEGLAKAIPLPQGLELAKIQFRENGPEEYIMAINVYSVYGLGGLVAGVRAEWDVFVTDNGSSQSYFMIIDAQSSMDSLDPDHPRGTKAAVQFQHEAVNGTSYTYVEAEDGSSFQATFPMPAKCPDMEVSDVCDPPTVAVAAANDKVYWRNGIHDVGHWDVDAWKGSLSLVDVDTIDIMHNTKWAEFLEPKPLELVLFQKPQTYYFSPWYNVGEIDICSS